MKTIMLYGSLGERFGKVHRFKVNSPAEAIRALSANFKGFKQALIDGGHYRFLLGGKYDIEPEKSHYPSSDYESIRIVPVVQGSGGLGKIALGAAMIYFASALPTIAWGVGAKSMAIDLSLMATSIGTSLIIGGVSEMLFAPQNQSASAAERPDNKPSFIFNGAVNTSRQGNPVPVAYGRVLVGSQVISAGLEAKRIAV